MWYLAGGRAGLSISFEKCLSLTCFRGRDVPRSHVDHVPWRTPLLRAALQLSTIPLVFRHEPVAISRSSLALRCSVSSRFEECVGRTKVDDLSCRSSILTRQRYFPTLLIVHSKLCGEERVPWMETAFLRFREALYIHIYIFIYAYSFCESKNFYFSTSHKKKRAPCTLCKIPIERSKITYSVLCVLVAQLLCTIFRIFSRYLLLFLFFFFCFVSHAKRQTASRGTARREDDAAIVFVM